jgi:hypothetical protein
VALELIFIDDDGLPTEPVIVGAAEHLALMTAAERLELPWLCRLRAYDADGEIPHEELGRFIGELATLECSILVDRPIRALVRRIRTLSEAALAAAKPLLAVAE